MNAARIVSLVLVLTALAPAFAERIFEKKENATNVVTGTVTKVYSKDSKLGDTGVFTHYLVEIKVQKVEKGDGIKPEQPLYVRCSRPTKQPGTPIAGPSGHRYIPKEGETIRAFLNRQPDGGFEVVYPEGIDPLGKVEK